MKIFLTGGTGFIGQALVQAMCARDWDVVAMARYPQSARAAWMAEQGVRVVSGDVTKKAGLEEKMAGCDIVLHSAGVYELGLNKAQTKRMQEVNVTGADNILAAAMAAGVPRTIHVSSTMALGPSGYEADPGGRQADETQKHPERFLTPYERSKFDSQEVALHYRSQGMQLNIVMPNAVCGINDHSLWGYYLRLYLLGAMPPIGFARDRMMAFVEVNALAEGICKVIEKARSGEDYLFAGAPISIETLFQYFHKVTGRYKIRLWLPRWVMKPQMAIFELMLRGLGVPAFMSRDSIEASRGHYNYSSAKAKRDLDWNHPDPQTTWEAIVAGEAGLISARHGFLNRLRDQDVLR